MALVTRYFSTAGAGAADGTSWADRAPLLNGTTFSAVFNAMDFASDSYIAYVGPGTHSGVNVSLSNGLFPSPPTTSNPLLIHGCDGSGVPIEPPLAWSSAQPADWESDLPIIEGTGTSWLYNSAQISARCMKFRVGGRAGAGVNSLGQLHWCVVENFTDSISAAAVASSGETRNCVFRCSGNSYNYVLQTSNSATALNCRLEGNPSAVSGEKDGIRNGGTSAIKSASGLTIINNPGRGYYNPVGNAATNTILDRCVLANNGGSGLVFANVASPTGVHSLFNSFVVNNGGWGLDGVIANCRIFRSRFRNNSSGDITSTSNGFVIGNITDAGADADEFVDAANGDYRIKFGSPYWGMGIGAGDAPIDPDAIAAAVWSRAGRELTA